jgi:hypothetical protein
VIALVEEKKGNSTRVNLSIVDGSKVLWDRSVHSMKVEEMKEQAYKIIRKMEGV